MSASVEVNKLPEINYILVYAIQYVFNVLW